MKIMIMRIFFVDRQHLKVPSVWSMDTLTCDQELGGTMSQTINPVVHTVL